MNSEYPIRLSPPWSYQVLFLILSVLGTFCCAAEDRIIDIAGNKQLFIDDALIASSENIAFHVNPPVKTGETTLAPDKPWESASLNWFSVMEDDGKFRMWYECYDIEGWPTPDDTSFCYAESKDGVHWEKPALGLYDYQGSRDTNILFRQIGPGGARSRVHGAGVFKDPAAPPEARYKAVSQGMFRGYAPPYRVAGMVSPDGWHWTRLSKPICDVFADSQYSGWWDAAAGHYVLLGRVSGHGRAIGRSENPAFDTFPPLTLALQTEAEVFPDADLYNPAALHYPHADSVYFMFPSLYSHSTDTLDIHLAVSRDGIHWSWPEQGKPFVALGDAGSFDSGSLYMGQGMIRSGNEIWMYYSGSSLKHNETELDALVKPENRRIFSRVVCRLDGFVSIDAGEETGRFLTLPLKFEGAKLEVNLKTRAGGEVRIGLRDASGREVPGHTLEDCIPIAGDHVAKVVTWGIGTDLPTCADTPVRLDVSMKNASLYAFQFVP